MNYTVEMVDADWLARAIQPALEFRERYNVPVYCGEFGCSQGLPDGSGLRWVRDMGELLSRSGIPWTYWNWRETLGPGSMSVWCQDPDGYYVLNGLLWHTLSDLWSE